jgi:hypothetical protein
MILGVTSPSTFSTSKPLRNIHENKDEGENEHTIKQDESEPEFDKPRKHIVDHLQIKTREEKKAETTKDVSPLLGNDRVRNIKVMETMFNTSGVFGSRANKMHKKKSKYWDAENLLDLMGSVSKFE